MLLFLCVLMWHYLCTAYHGKSYPISTTRVYHRGLTCSDIPRVSAGGVMADVGCGHGLTSCLLAEAFPNATVIGDVQLGAGSSIWHSVIVRGDTASIKIGKNTTV